MKNTKKIKIAKNSHKETEKRVTKIQKKSNVFVDKGKGKFKKVVKKNKHLSLDVNEPAHPLIKKKIANEKKCIYSCITGAYDHILPIKTSHIPHLLYTDNLNIEAPGWEVLPLPKNWNSCHPQLKARLAKWLPHKLLPKEYEYSLWQDGNLLQKYDVSEFFDLGIDFATNPHPKRDCAWDELDACRLLKKDNPKNLDNIEMIYKKNKIPRNNGVFETNVILRNHNKHEVINICEQVSYYMHNLCIRDQLILPLIETSYISPIKMINMYRKKRHNKKTN